jgi:hypothetical protein
MRVLRSRGIASLLAIFVACTGQESPPGPATAAEQAAAMELGFAAGSMLAQVALPLQARTESFAGFARSEDDLRMFLGRLPIENSDVATVVAAFGEGFANANPIAGAQRLLAGMNLVKDRLSASAHPDLMHVYRIGMMVGHTIETAVVVTRGNPTPKHIETISGLLARYRTTLPQDLAQARLPADVTEAARRVGAEIHSAEDLDAVIGACLTVKDLVERLKMAGAPRSETWSKHTHPHGFTFAYPAGWTVQDDPKNKSTLLLPPGVTLESPGPKAILIVAATPNVSDPLALRQYFESQFGNARVEDYTEEPFTGGIGPGAILGWEVTVPRTNTKSGFRSIIVIIESWAVHVDAYGPKEQARVHDAAMRRIATSFAWE